AVAARRGEQLGKSGSPLGLPLDTRLPSFDSATGSPLAGLERVCQAGIWRRGDVTAQERQRAPSCLDGIVTMAAQFDIDAARVTDLRQRSQDLGEVDLALAEHQMIVNAAPHVFDVDIP